MWTRCAALVVLLLCALGHAGAQDTPQSAASYAQALVSRALQLYAGGNCESSLSLSQSAAEAMRASGETQTETFATALVAQGLCFKRTLRVAEAERAYRQAIDVYEAVQGPNGRDLAIALDNLASLFAEHRRLAEAEQLRLRALQIFRSTLGPGSPHIVTTLQNLAVLYQLQEQLPKALETYLEALAAAEKAYGAQSRQVGVISDNLAGLYRSRGQFDQAEPLYLRAIAAFEASVGADHPDSVLALQNYAIQLGETGRLDAAEARLKQALAVNERLYGSSHAVVGAALNTLVLQYISQGRWSDALAMSRRAAEVHHRLAGRGKANPPSESGQRGSPFRRLVQAAHGVGPAADPALMDESYAAAQRALHTDASLALSQLAVRHAAGTGPLATLVREQQDLVQELETRDRLLVAAVAKVPSQRDPKGEAAIRDRLAAISSRIDQIGAELGSAFPDYLALSQPEPLSIAATQALLQPDEVLIQYLDVQPVRGVPGTAFAWVVTKTDAQWVRLRLGTAEIARAVATLRCGLDAAQWLDAGTRRCRELLKRDALPGAPLPFDLQVAHDLYGALLGPFEASLKGKHLLVVPSGALTTLPLAVLVAEKPEHAIPPTTQGYRDAAWLGLRQPITVLPSVAALKGLRELTKASRAKRPYLGVGNPLLDGQQADPQYGAYFKELALAARGKQQCLAVAPQHATAPAVRRTARLDRLFRGRQADTEMIRELAPLPETADELCEIGRRLGAPESEILLGERATETALKELSERGRLAEYAVLHLATHGALAGEVQGSSEPGLVLTPPAKDGTPAGGKAAPGGDDGFLTASEIATLKLDANWVVLSACNTAGGGSGNAEALSGLARAFFYSGARALLVSHWAVDSYAAVKLTTRAFEVLKARPATGRAEALRLSMRDLVERGTPAEWHPSRWAPFVVVGEGARMDPLRPTRSAKDLKPRTKSPAADWLTDVWQP